MFEDLISTDNYLNNYKKVVFMVIYNRFRTLSI